MYQIMINHFPYCHIKSIIKFYNLFDYMIFDVILPIYHHIWNLKEFIIFQFRIENSSSITLKMRMCQILMGWSEIQYLSLTCFDVIFTRNGSKTHDWLSFAFLTHVIFHLLKIDRLNNTHNYGDVYRTTHLMHLRRNTLYNIHKRVPHKTHDRGDQVRYIDLLEENIT